MDRRRPERAEPHLGTCPVCDARIPRTGLLIRYETSEGWPRLFAECPTCEVPVHPQ